MNLTQFHKKSEPVFTVYRKFKNKCENAKILNTPQKWKNVNVNCIMHYAYATKQPRKKQK